MTRGVMTRLEVDEITGRTNIIKQQDVPVTSGLLVHLLADRRWDRGYRPDDRLAALVIDAAGKGQDYDGPSSPWWYGPIDFTKLLLTAPGDVTAADVVRDLGLVPPQHLGARLANSFSQIEAAELLELLRERNSPVKPEKIGQLGRDYANNWPGYAIKTGVTHELEGGRVPYVIEVYATCERSTERGRGTVRSDLLINNQPSWGNWADHQILMAYV